MTAYPLVDAHCHLGEGDEAYFLDLLQQEHLLASVNAASLSEWQRLSASFLASTSVKVSFGIHPWRASDVLDHTTRNMREDHSLTPKQFLRLGQAEEDVLRKAAIVGEIGMDSVWTEQPLSTQRLVFLQQLDLALQLNKPVILHTKGAEEEIATTLVERLSQFPTPPPIAVHWYSGSTDALRSFIHLGFYFTLAPDISTNPTQQQVALMAPLNRLLSETDGCSAVTWATGKECWLHDIPGILQGIVAAATSLRGIGADDLRQAIYDNYMRFTGNITSSEIPQ